MKRVLICASLAVAFAAGIALAQAVMHNVACRDKIGLLFGRGHLLALTHGQGIYEIDLQRVLARWKYASGQTDVDFAGNDRRGALLEDLISDSALAHLAKDEAVPRQIDHEQALVQAQFADRARWLKALAGNRLLPRRVSGQIATNLRASKWVEHRLIDALTVSNEECQEYFMAHGQDFALPARFRASHLFLAAPSETPQPIIDQQREKIDALSSRIRQGEKFTDLVAEASEDEATKKQAGDLGFFSEARMPSDFVEGIAKMKIGEISAPIQTELGFHIVQLIDSKPARLMSFEEAEPEIRLRLQNEKRRIFVRRIKQELNERALVVNNTAEAVQ